MPDVSVKCFYFNEQAFWKNASEFKKAEDHSLDVWKIQFHTDDATAGDGYMTGLLNWKEKERYDRYHKNEDRKRFSAGRIVLKILLGQYLDQDPETIQLNEHANKKPFVLRNGRQDLEFNLSHSEKCILVAISKYNVGVDLEFINKNFRYDDIIASAFSVEEKDFVKQSGKPDQAFYLLWTRKEALLKGTGKGLVDNLPDIPSLNGVHDISGGIIESTNSWQICSFGVGDEYIASVAYGSNIDRVRFFEVEVDKHADHDLAGYLKSQLG